MIAHGQYTKEKKKYLEGLIDHILNNSNNRYGI